MKVLKKKLIKCLIIVLACVLVVGASLGIGIWEFSKDTYYINKEDNVLFQRTHMEYLRNEYYENYLPKGEQTFCNFDLETAINSGIKYNEVAFLATHNSYQRLVTEQTKKYQIPFNVLSFGITTLTDFNKNNFENDTLTGQFEHGIRSIELDVETRVYGDKVSFTTMHKPIIDSATSCFDFETALEEIVLWSDHNPGHLPISIIIEDKQEVGAVDGLKKFSIDYADEFDALLKGKLGDKLLTPGDMLREHSTFKDMREADDWMKLEDTLGKVIVILHEGELTQKYVALDESLRTQAMFPSLLYKQAEKRDYASFIVENNPKDAVNREDFYVEGNFVVRTRADHYPKSSDERYSLTEECKSQIITTDYCPRNCREEEHTYSFGGYTVKLVG